MDNHSITQRKRLSQNDKEKLELDLVKIFEEVDISQLLKDLQKLNDVRAELEQLHEILELSKCCLQKVCSKKSWFC